jgi:hypothetical protein
MPYSYWHTDPFLSETNAQRMLRIAETFGRFGTYAEEASCDGLGETLPQRFDAALNYISHGIDGSGNGESFEVAARRTNYFRETYAYGDHQKTPDIDAFMNDPGLLAAVYDMNGSQAVVPAIVFANLLVPGQELAVHTDVPEFRGLNRKNCPQWLLVCMHHSGLFDAWRIPILTCVSWFGESSGGAFTFYPHGAEGIRTSLPARHNSAVLLDTDSVFHGVERVAPETTDLPVIEPGTLLSFCGGDAWQLERDGEVLAQYHWSDIRYSISWKGYCFADEAAHSLWRSNSDNLTIDRVLGVFEADRKARHLDSIDTLSPNDRALALVERYIRFPAKQASANSD